MNMSNNIYLSTDLDPYRLLSHLLSTTTEDKKFDKHGNLISRRRRDGVWIDL
jgi:hypothetical protein